MLAITAAANGTQEPTHCRRLYKSLGGIGLAKITDFTTPLGVKGNLLSVSSWLNVILGAVVLIIGFAIGQTATGWIGRKVPAIDTTIDPIIRQPATSNAPVREVY